MGERDFASRSSVQKGLTMPASQRGLGTRDSRGRTAQGRRGSYQLPLPLRGPRGREVRAPLRHAGKKLAYLPLETQQNSPNFQRVAAAESGRVSIARTYSPFGGEGHVYVLRRRPNTVCRLR